MLMVVVVVVMMEVLRGDNEGRSGSGVSDGSGGDGKI